MKLDERIKAKYSQMSAVEKDYQKKRIAIGNILIEVKSGMKHGDFCNWVDKQMPFSRSTAWNYMKMARIFAV